MAGETPPPHLKWKSYFLVFFPTPSLILPQTSLLFSLWLPWPTSSSLLWIGRLLLKSQLICLSLLCKLFICLFRWFFCLKDLEQIRQSKGLPPLCLSWRCRFIMPFVVNFFPQTLHLNSFWSLWVSMCLLLWMQKWLRNLLCLFVEKSHFSHLYSSFFPSMVRNLIIWNLWILLTFWQESRIFAGMIMMRMVWWLLSV